MSIEFELKYSATPRQLSAIEQAFSQPAQQLTMETDYYDTPAGDLAARRITLRRRLENGIPVCTLKTPAVNGARGEYECRSDSVIQSFETLCKYAKLPALLALAEKGLVCTCGARFTRIAKVLILDGCTVELALDQGFLTGGNRTLPLCEVEVELKEGSQEAACRFAETLAAEYDLAPESRSKFRRALMLAKGESV